VSLVGEGVTRKRREALPVWAKVCRSSGDCDGGRGVFISRFHGMPLPERLTVRVCTFLRSIYGDGLGLSLHDPAGPGVLETLETGYTHFGSVEFVGNHNGTVPGVFSPHLLSSAACVAFYPSPHTRTRSADEHYGHDPLAVLWTDWRVPELFVLRTVMNVMGRTLSTPAVHRVRSILCSCF
jgi:hypothetical protein